MTDAWDVLAAPVTAVAADLATGIEPGPVREVTGDLEDESFAAQITRSRYRPASQSEGELTTEVLRDLNARSGVMARKVHGSGVAGSGEPDLDICYHGRAVKIELKVRGGDRNEKPTPKQHRRMLQWQQAGALVGWGTSLEEVLAILAHWDDRSYRYTGQAGGG